MTAYKAPLEDMMFVLQHVAGFKDPSLSSDDLRLVLESASQLAGEVIAPLNHSGDKQGCKRLDDGSVKTPGGFSAAYRQYVEGGWNGVPFNPDHGGQGLPWLVTFPVQEMWQSASVAFSLCPLLTQAAVEAIENHGTPEQKKTYLAKLIAGAWTGTMNLTEPDAGTDLGAVKTKAVKQPDGTYKIKGQKIYITFGEHDMAENIIHLVLARVPDAPAGTKGISMFIVPKFLVNADGSLGARNDVKCVSIEHKLGIHGSPTCTMQYGDADGATGFLVGQENEGLKYMFTMMNNARLSVGLQGIAVAERATQQAVAFAQERKQSARLNEKGGAPVPIIEHQDVKRMILTMAAYTQAARALAYDAANALDRAKAGDAASQARVDLLTPVVKAWSTEISQTVTSLGIQIHGGMGFIEETGAAQHYRDARILPIYEGTNGIQSLDLVFRKILLNGGEAVRVWIDEAVSVHGRLAAVPALSVLHEELGLALDDFRAATAWLLQKGLEKKQDDVAAVSMPYLMAFGTVAGGVMMARAALAAQTIDDKGFAGAKTALALFYATHILPQTSSHVRTVTTGADAVLAFKTA